MTGEKRAVPWHIWVVGALTLLWNAVGVYSYLMTRLGKLESLGMTPDQIAYFDSYPAWANAVWALGVWGALLGSILILMRSRYAVPALIGSLIGLAGTTIYQHALTQTPPSLQNPALDVVIWAVVMATFWYAVVQRRRSVLR